MPGVHHSQSRGGPEQVILQDSINTRKGLSKYKELILEIDEKIEPYYFALAGFFPWLLLAGFLVSPSTYASVQQSNALDSTGRVGKSITDAVRNVPLIYIASFACLGATSGLGWLWYKWYYNYIWISRYIIVPTLTHSALGLGSALLNIYSMQGGQWSITAIITVTIIGTWFVVSAALYIIYDRIMLPKLKETHEMLVV